MSSLPVHPAAVPDFPEGLNEERDELSPLVTVVQDSITKRTKKMFSKRIERAFCCCQVRTGALVVATVCLMIAIITVVDRSFDLANFDVDYAIWLQELRAGAAQWGDDDFWGNLIDVLEQHKEDFRRFTQLGLVYQIGECVINILLIWGLAKKKHVPCLPWLIYSGVCLIGLAVLIVSAVILLWVLGFVGYGFLTLFLGILFVAFYFHIFKVVQTEWMVIKDLDAPARQVELGGKC